MTQQAEGVGNWEVVVEHDIIVNTHLSLLHVGHSKLLMMVLLLSYIG